MTPGIKYTLYTVLFYFILFFVGVCLIPVGIAGPCDAGVGLAILLRIPIIAKVGFLISLAGVARRGKLFVGPAIVNGLVLMGVVLLHLR